MTQEALAERASDDPTAAELRAWAYHPDQSLEDRAAELLRANVGAKKAAELTAHEGSAKAAYTKWLNGYMDKKIVPSRYRCTNEAVDGDEVPHATSGAAS